MCFKIQCSTKCREKEEDLKGTPFSEGEKKALPDPVKAASTGQNALYL